MGLLTSVTAVLVPSTECEMVGFVSDDRIMGLAGSVGEIAVAGLVSILTVWLDVVVVELEMVAGGVLSGDVPVDPR